MSPKDSQLESFPPKLCRCYKKSNKIIFGIEPYVPESLYGKFRVLEDDLRDADIDMSEYSDTVVILLKQFVLKKKMTHVPVNMFCGTYAWNLFQKSKQMKTVDISIRQDVDVLLLDELKVARYYIETGRTSGRLVLFKDAVTAIRPMLSKEWLRCYRMKLGRPVDAAVEILRQEYKCLDAKTYIDFIRHGHI